MALWFEERRRYDDARRAFESFLKSYPSSRGSPIASFGLGMILSRHRGDPEAARPHLEAAARSSNDPSIRAAAERELDRPG
jgi:TolA-binding protein